MPRNSLGFEIQRPPPIASLPTALDTTKHPPVAASPSNHRKSRVRMSTMCAAFWFLATLGVGLGMGLWIGMMDSDEELCPALPKNLYEPMLPASIFNMETARDAVARNATHNNQVLTLDTMNIPVPLTDAQKSAASEMAAIRVNFQRAVAFPMQDVTMSSTPIAFDDVMPSSRSFRRTYEDDGEIKTSVYTLNPTQGTAVYESTNDTLTIVSSVDCYYRSSANESPTLHRCMAAVERGITCTHTWCEFGLMVPVRSGATKVVLMVVNADATSMHQYKWYANLRSASWDCNYIKYRFMSETRDWDVNSCRPGVGQFEGACSRLSSTTLGTVDPLYDMTELFITSVCGYETLFSTDGGYVYNAV
jgi:hypothetical protein